MGGAGVLGRASLVNSSHCQVYSKYFINIRVTVKFSQSIINILVTVKFSQSIIKLDSDSDVNNTLIKLDSDSNVNIIRLLNLTVMRMLI